MILAPYICSCAWSGQQHEKGHKAKPPHVQLQIYLKVAAMQEQISCVAVDTD